MHVQCTTAVFVVICMLPVVVSYVLAKKEKLQSECGGFHCVDSCCKDDLGNESCCSSSLVQEPWFWVLMVIGFIIIAFTALCCCRTAYRYHNAGQYTKLRLQQPSYYGTVDSTPRIHLPPDRNDSPLPSYTAVAGRPPPYSESEQ